MLHGLPAEEALKYTPQSWRHLYPTMGRQLQLPDEQLNEIGHWSAKSGMPRHYDSTACVSELAAKASVLSAVRAGWHPVGPGMVLLPNPGTPVPAFAAPATPVAAPPERQRSTSDGSGVLGCGPLLGTIACPGGSSSPCVHFGGYVAMVPCPGVALRMAGTILHLRTAPRVGSSSNDNLDPALGREGQTSKSMATAVKNIGIVVHLLPPSSPAPRSFPPFPPSRFAHRFVSSPPGLGSEGVARATTGEAAGAERVVRRRRRNMRRRRKRMGKRRIHNCHYHHYQHY